MTPWDDDRSFVEETKDTAGQITYSGVVIYQGLEFRFRANPQNSGKYVYRGRVSAISPTDGLVVQVRGAEAIRRLDAQPDTSDSPPKKRRNKALRNKALNVSAEVYSQATDRLGIMDAVLKAVKRIYINHAILLMGELQKSVRPETITPSAAAILFADSFISVHHKNIDDTTAKRYAKRLKDMYAELPDVPMSTYKQSMAKQFLSSHKVSQSIHRTLSDFWEFLLLKGHASGINPFPPVKARKISSAQKQRNAKILTELTLEQQDALYSHLMSKPICGGDCGVALLTWGALPAGEDTLRWKDIIMDPQQRDYVLIKHRRDDLAGATHNFEQPQTIQAARILWRQWDTLRLTYSARELLDMPVIALQRNPQKVMTINALTQYAGRMLRIIGISNAVFAVQNKSEKTAVAKRILQMTHQKNIYQRYGLEYDEGTKQFLQLVSLRGNVTDDRYASFTEKDAQKRIYAAQLAIRPYEIIHDNEQEEEVLPDGSTSITAYPEHTRERVGIVCAVKIPPGETATIHCRHGVTGEYRTREINPDGSLRRKSKSKSKT